MGIRALGVAAIVFLIVGCSSQPKATTTSVPTSTSGGQRQVTSAEDNAGPVDLPEVLAGVDPAEVLNQLREAGLDEWVETVTGLLVAGSPAAACGDLAYETITTDQFEAAAQLEDWVLGELILDIDASLSAAQAVCEAGDDVHAAAEVDDAGSNISLLQQRIAELEDRS